MIMYSSFQTEKNPISTSDIGFFYNIKHKKQFLKETVEKLDENSSALAEKELKYFEEIGLIWHS